MLNREKHSKYCLNLRQGKVFMIKQFFNRTENILKTALVPFFIIVFFLSISAQNTEISGKVTEKSTGNPIPYANIYFAGTYIGTTSDVNGNYNLVTSKANTVVDISAIGYKKQSVPIRVNQKNLINFELVEEIFNLEEVVIYPGENPANAIFHKVVNQKKENNPAEFPSWHSHVYAKTEIDIKNVNSNLKNKKLLSQFSFVFNYIDSLELEGKTFLPVFFNETISNLYHESNQNKNKEEIIANKASGMTTDMLSQFTGKKYEDINIYDNYITFSDIGFISPINNLGMQFYKYYLLDSIVTSDSKIYELSFRPKLPQEPVFKGKFWVEDGSFALTKLEMQLSEKANVNFVNNLQYSIEYQKKEGRWVPRNESIVADVDIQKDKNSEKMGIIARKTNIYEDFGVGSVTQAIDKIKDPIVVAKDAMSKDDLFWAKTRPVELQEREKNIYLMVDSIKNLKLYHTAAEYIYMFYYGYRDFGKFELGPYFYLYSSNKVEGSRFRLGARTTFKFDKKIRLNAFGAYGILDNKMKYGGGFEYYFSVKPISMIAFQGQHDIEMLGKSNWAFVEQNILTTMLAKRPNSKLNMIDRFELTAKHEWKVGFMNELSISSSKIYTAPFVRLVTPEGAILPFIKSSEVTLRFRYAPYEDIVVDNFERNTYSYNYTTLMFHVTKGIKGFLGGDYNYLKLNAAYYDKLIMNPIGYTTVCLQAGKIWGNVPFPYLKIHEGNETYAYDIYAFNLMNYQEFISDTYASLFLEHHFVGFFLNKVPLFRKLKWREVVGMRTLWGTYNQAKHNSLLLPGDMKGLGNQPYTEFSAGVENIIKFLRVDGVWRFNYNGQTKHQFGLLFSLQATL